MDSYQYPRSAPRVEPASDAAPTTCPTCRSVDISTTARPTDGSAYWRCAACGEVWNAARRAAARNGRVPWR